MLASLIESPDEHHWVLLDHRVTELAMDMQSFRFQTWSLDGSAAVRVAAPFTLRLTSGGAERTLDPAETQALAPTLALLRRRMTSLTVTSAGELSAEFADGMALLVRPSLRLEAWEVVGGGLLEGLSYRCPPGGGAPWG